jgi:hypothetical protein
METKGPLLPQKGRVPVVTAGSKPEASGETTLATRDHDVIRHWAARRKAEPATGEATASGPSTVNVRDGDAGIRFNFQGVSLYRPIGWDEWLDHFDRHGLLFVYEEESADGTASTRYRIVRPADWEGQFADAPSPRR